MQGMQRLTFQRIGQAWNKQQLPESIGENEFCHRSPSPSDQ